MRQDGIENAGIFQHVVRAIHKLSILLQAIIFKQAPGHLVDQLRILLDLYSFVTIPV